MEALRAKPRVAVGIAVAALLVAVWLGWAVYVASDRGINEGLGVLIAWPALVLALALVSLPFVGIYLLVRRGSEEEPVEEDQPSGEQEDESGEEEKPRDEAEEADEDEKPEDEDEPEGESDDEGSEDAGSEDEESEPEPETAAS